MADVATTSAIGAVVAVAWPLVQACLDKPSWTPAKRRVLALAAAIVIAAAAWFSSNHPPAVGSPGRPGGRLRRLHPDRVHRPQGR